MKNLFLLGFLVSTAYGISIDINVNRSFNLTSPTASSYVSGNTAVNIIDGSYTLSPCLQGGQELILPNLACPLGTTAFIQSGDLDGDGIVDDRSYWSISSVARGTVIEPFFPTGVTLAAAPPSRLARPLGDFRDNSLAVFFNMLTPVITLNEISSYRYSRDFNGLTSPTAYATHAESWVPGVYVYSIPIKGQFNRFATVKVTLTAMVEANGYRKGLRGFGLVGANWFDGAHEIDPRLITRLRWQGPSRSNTVASDVVEFSMRVDDGTDPEGIVYPVPNSAYRLDSPFLTQLNMLPYVFQKGDTGFSRISFSRSLVTSNIASDISNRTWTWRNRFIDSYRGHDLYEYRLTNSAAIPGIKVAGTPSRLRQPKADYDGDGISNIMEFAFSQDDEDDVATSLEWTSYHNDPDSQPSEEDMENLGVSPPTTLPPLFLDTGNAGVVTEPYVFNKRRNVGGSITYGYEVNYDTSNPRSRWVKLPAPRPGQSIVVSCNCARRIAVDPNFRWTISDTLDTGEPDNAPGTTSIRASHPLPSTVRVRSTAAVTRGY